MGPDLVILMGLGRLHFFTYYLRFPDGQFFRASDLRYLKRHVDFYSLLQYIHYLIIDIFVVQILICLNQRNGILMTKETAIKLFNQKQVRCHWDNEKEKWYFSVADVVGVLSDSGNPQTYWRVLKKRLLAEGNETVTNCNALKMVAADGKMRFTDVADTEQLFRLIQSVPSPKAEPFKIWLARVGSERIDEIEDPDRVGPLPEIHARQLKQNLAGRSSHVKMQSSYNKGRIRRLETASDVIKNLVKKGPDCGS